MSASEVASFKTNFFRIARTSEAETSVSGKAECLLVFGKDKKISFLEQPFPLREKSGNSLNFRGSTVYLQVSLYKYTLHI